MTFIETRLLDELAYGFSGGPQWRTMVTPLRNRFERRNIQGSRPQHRFSGSFDRREAGVVATLLATHNATYGAAVGFRFKNWLDFTATAQLLPAGTGAARTVQLTKAYTFGASSVAVPIRKPVAATVTLTADGSPLAHSLDAATGMVTYTASPGAVVRWSGEFDLPVRFATDDFSATMDTFGATTVDIELIEDLSA